MTDEHPRKTFVLTVDASLHTPVVVSFAADGDRRVQKMKPLPNGRWTSTLNDVTLDITIDFQERNRQLTGGA